MTSKELQEKLKTYPDDMEVMLYDDETGYNYPIKEVEVEHALTHENKTIGLAEFLSVQKAVNVIVLR